MFLGANPSLGPPAQPAPQQRTAASGAAPSSAGDHDHDHGEGCSCGRGAAPPLMQSLDEMDFERGIWGLITRGGNARQCLTFFEEHGGPARWVNARDKSGYTPLLYASRAGGHDVCELLLSNGADINASTPGFKQTSLHRAAAAGHEHVVSLLVKHGADRSAVDGHGMTPADAAEKQGHLGLASLLRRNSS